MNKKIIAIVIMMVMVISGISVIASAMASPQNNAYNSLDVTGSGPTETATGFNNDGVATLTASGYSFNVGQTVTWSGSISLPSVSDYSGMFAYLYYNGHSISSSPAVEHGHTVLWSVSHTFKTSGTKSWYIFVPIIGGGYFNSGTSYISVYANPTVNSNPSVSISAPSPSIALGQSSLLTANVNGGSGPYTYSWSESGASGHFSSISSANTVFIPTSTGIANITLTVTNADGVSTIAHTTLTSYSTHLNFTASMTISLLSITIQFLSVMHTIIHDFISLFSNLFIIGKFY